MNTRTEKRMDLEVHCLVQCLRNELIWLYFYLAEKINLCQAVFVKHRPSCVIKLSVANTNGTFKIRQMIYFPKLFYSSFGVSESCYYHKENCPYDMILKASSRMRIPATVSLGLIKMISTLNHVHQKVLKPRPFKNSRISFAQNFGKKISSTRMRHACEQVYK